MVQETVSLRPSAKNLSDMIHAWPFRNRIRFRARSWGALALAWFASIPRDRNWVFFPYYHFVFDDERRQFDRQLKYFSQLGQFISLDDAVDALRNPKGVDGRYFCITFDDGFKNNCTNALPILLQHRAPAAFFIPTDYVGLQMERDWNRIEHFFSRTESYPLPIDFLSWEDCRTLLDAGMTIGSHTCSHIALQGLSEPELEHELVDSKRCIEERLGIECRHFCCPWGIPKIHFDPERHLPLARQAGYRSFLSTEYGYNTSIDDHTYIKRRGLTALDSTAIVRYALGQCTRG